jgi:signal peptidase II
MSLAQVASAEGRQSPPWRARGVRVLAVALLVALDLWSKQAVFAYLGDAPERLQADRHGHLRLPLAGEWLTFMLSYNEGMAWGLRLPPYVLIGARLAAVAFLVWLLFKSALGRGATTAAFALILAGALGNLYDNLALEPRTSGHPFGAVRDFIDVYFAVWDWHFPTFNVADSCITVGALLLLATSFRASAPAGPSPAAA